MPTYTIEEGSIQEQFHNSRAKVQMFGGGFANGKSAALCIKALRIARAYPGSNGLLARATYPKLTDTLYKEFLKWCPKHWIATKTKTPLDIVLTNGTHITFRYVQQQGKNSETSSSNLLSATYDWIGVDQVEDPEISHKDFLDLLGRLRGSTARTDNDVSMPRTGPRFLMLTCNPSRNWLYQKIIGPFLTYKRTGIITPDLLYDEETKQPILELFEGSTYTNKNNLEPDFIKTLETAYKGQMRQRYLMGEWGAFEGLVYPGFNQDLHVLTANEVKFYHQELTSQRVRLNWLEAYDHGISEPSCYLLAFIDNFGNIIIVDGFYEREKTIESHAKAIRAIRRRWSIADSSDIYADPALFRRVATEQTVADIFWQHGLRFIRADNAVMSGITKTNGYIWPADFHAHPIRGSRPAPYLYVNADLTWYTDEITNYMWKRNTSNEFTDVPVDKNDHAMDATRYLLTRQPKFATVRGIKQQLQAVSMWHERDVRERYAEHRYV